MSFHKQNREFGSALTTRDPQLGNPVSTPLPYHKARAKNETTPQKKFRSGSPNKITMLRKRVLVDKGKASDS